MDQNPEMPSVSAPKSNKEEHEKILAALRKEFDYDTGASGKDHYQQICRTLEAIENSSKHGFRWPRAQEQKDQLLAEKAQYETTPELMNYPGSFAEQVQLGVANIVKHKLKHGLMQGNIISIHPPLVGWDPDDAQTQAETAKFQSTHPVWGGTSAYGRRCSSAWRNTALHQRATDLYRMYCAVPA